MQVIRHENHFANVHPVERLASVLSGSALAVSGLRKGKAGMFQLATGAIMIQRGVTGRCQVYRALGVRTARVPDNTTLPYELGVRARSAVTINQPREVVWEFWRKLENLPRFMRHLKSVEQRDGNRSHWVANGPMDRNVEWDAEIINEIRGELIAWKSLPGSDVDSAGSVRFTDAPGNRGTEVRVELQYNPPAGIVGAYVAKMFGREPEQEIEADLLRLKQYLEAGEVVTTEGQPHGAQSKTRIIPVLEEVRA